MDADLLNDIKADLRHIPAWRVMAGHVKPERADEVIEAVIRVAVEACAEICDRQAASIPAAFFRLRDCAGEIRALLNNSADSNNEEWN